jgi:hypothetical protein
VLKKPARPLACAQATMSSFCVWRYAIRISKNVGAPRDAAAMAAFKGGFRKFRIRGLPFQCACVGSKWHAGLRASFVHQERSPRVQLAAAARLPLPRSIERLTCDAGSSACTTCALSCCPGSKAPPPGGPGLGAARALLVRRGLLRAQGAPHTIHGGARAPV